MAPIYPRAGNLAVDSASLRLGELDTDDDSLFEDLFVEDSFDSLLLGRWLNRRQGSVIFDAAAADSNAESLDSDVDSVDSDADSMDSLDDSDSEEDSDDDFPDIEVLANGDSGDGTSTSVTESPQTSSIPRPPPPPPPPSPQITTTTSPSPAGITTTPTNPGASTRKGITFSTGVATSKGGSSGGVQNSTARESSSVFATSTVSTSSSSASSSPTQIESNADKSPKSVSPNNVIAGVTLFSFFALVIAGLLLWRRIRRNRVQNSSTIVPFPVEFAHPGLPASAPSVRRTRFSYFSSILPSGTIASRDTTHITESKGLWAQLP
ncbi:hypothetical protein C8J57DRAFT_1714004 [Mycena rebaudengoi]|nr:hypothetical protein C8J57DRAFT_1714004 [Mycena rebaudengoi]